MSLSRPPVKLMTAGIKDWPLIRGWLAMPEVQGWWGPLQTIEAEVMMALNSPHAICRVILAGDTAVGYGQAFDAMVWGDQLPADLEPGTWEIDLFIATETHRNKGHGTEALRLLSEEVFSTTLAVAVAVFPLVANERATRAYEKAGFRWKSVWQDPVAGPAWLMVLDRPRRM